MVKRVAEWDSGPFVGAVVDTSGAGKQLCLSVCSLILLSSSYAKLS